MIKKYSQYKNDLFNKLNLKFQKGKKLLDVGCGNGLDAKILKKEYGLKVYASDVYKDREFTYKDIPFKIGSVYILPYEANSFDYLFLHDVLHHIDEPRQRRMKHVSALEELRRICRKGGKIVIVEGNRYNPLFYPHMVKMRRHDHWKQSYFKSVIQSVFKSDKVEFRFFEAHHYPQKLLLLFKIYEKIMERFSPVQFLAYNVSIITKS